MSSDVVSAFGAGRLLGQVAVVTGASGSIGRQICLELAREGADIVAVGGHQRSEAAAVAREVEELGRRSLTLVAGVTQKGSVCALLGNVVAQFGKVDILVNGAGGGGVSKPLEDLSEEEWDRAFTINAKGTFLCSAAAVKHMRGQNRGAIINIAGASAHRSYPRRGAFGPSKAAVVSFTRQSSLEWAAYGIRVNGVSPGPIREPGTGWEDLEPALAREVKMLPLQRAGTSHDVARAVVYLASDDAAYITGQMLVVDGGGVNTWYLSLAGRYPDV